MDMPLHFLHLTAFKAGAMIF